MERLNSTLPSGKLPICFVFAFAVRLQVLLFFSGVDRVKLVGFVHVSIVSYVMSLQKSWSELGTHFWSFVQSLSFRVLSPVLQTPVSIFFLCVRQVTGKLYPLSGRGGSHRALDE